MKMMHSPLSQQSVSVEDGAMKFTQVWVKIIAADNLILALGTRSAPSWRVSPRPSRARSIAATSSVRSGRSGLSQAPTVRAAWLLAVVIEILFKRAGLPELFNVVGKARAPP
jgi:hypothetical protein